MLQQHISHCPAGLQQNIASLVPLCHFTALRMGLHQHILFICPEMCTCSHSMHCLFKACRPLVWYILFQMSDSSYLPCYCCIESKSLKKHPCYRHETLHSGYDIHIFRTLDVRVSGLLANCLKPSTSHHPRCRLWQFNSLGPNTTSY